MRNFAIIILFLVTNLVIAQNNYDINYLIPKGCEVPLSDPFGDYAPKFTDDGEIIRVEIHTARYNISPEEGNIYCWQRPDYNRHNLMMHFGNGVLDGISHDPELSKEGYLVFSSPSIVLALSSDGTMWGHVRKPGSKIILNSKIPGDYDVGGGLPLKPVAVAARRIFDTNWMIITDDKYDSSGGFGVYLRPALQHVFDSIGRLLKRDEGRYPKMVRDVKDKSRVEIISDFASGENSRSYKEKREIKFVVSMFPTKHRYAVEEMAQKRILFIYPNQMDGKRKRHGYYGFPTAEELNSWTDSTWTPVSTNKRSVNKFQYYSKFNGKKYNTPANMLVLFEDIWQFAGEDTDNQPDKIISKFSPHAFIKYQTPAKIYRSEQMLSNFFDLLSEDPYKKLDVLVYVSAFDQYNQLPRPLMRYKKMTEDEYYETFMAEIARLYKKYPRITGIYIDTLPLNGSWDPEGIDNPYRWESQLEPMVLSYRIMRDLKARWPKKFIILHSSENPIGPIRVWGSINKMIDNDSAERWTTSGLSQLDLFAPFIDRYADIMFRGEGYPIDIQLNKNNEVQDYVSRHIKYVVNPMGKSNSTGILKWTHTGIPFTDEDYYVHDKSYFNPAYPITLDAKSRNVYSKFNPQESNEEVSKINRLIVMNQIYDTYIKNKSLIMRSRTYQYNNPKKYERRMHHSVAGPGEAKKTYYDYPRGTYQYYNAVPAAWNSMNTSIIQPDTTD